jgi:hypothetical protein
VLGQLGTGLSWVVLSVGPDSPDPTGLSSPVGQLAIIAVLAAALVVGLRALWQRRNRK